MALAEVQKVQILAHSGIKMDILSSLQEEGIIQIEKTDLEELALSASSPEITSMEQEIQRISRALDYTEPWADKGLAEKLFSQKPQLSRKARKIFLLSDVHSLLEEIESHETEANELVSHMKVYEKEEEFLMPMQSLKVPIKAIKSTETAEIILGALPLPSFQSFVEETADKALVYHTVFKGKRRIYVLLIFHKSEKDQIEQTLKQMDFDTLYFPDSLLNKADDGDTVGDVLEKLKKEKEETAKKILALDEEGQRLTELREKLMRAYDVLKNERERLLSSRLLGDTDRVSYLEGWISTLDKQKLITKLKPYEDDVECFFRPPLQDEDPPVILKNPKAGGPFEIITKLYGLPQHGTLDPTLALAPFFFLFVGLTVSEAGYGFLVALLSLLLIKFGKPKGGMRQFLKLLSLLGFSTVILGTLVGGWFGFPVRKLMILDPLKDPLSFLILSLALGFIQVWFGTLLNMISEIKRKNYLKAVFVQGGWLVLLPALVLYALIKNPVWGIVALAGAAGIVFFASPSRNPLVRFFGGLYRLYDISRYLADVLSYSRLLALGLATSVIAMVVNTLCQTALGIPWLGWLFAALIFVGGHLFNLGISFLGGFVHSMRLQFVEFFSKFFISGGKPFKPLVLKGKYVEFT